MIITLADYKSLTGTTDTADDAVLNALLPGVNDLVELYCDRKFDAQNHVLWTNFHTPIVLPEYPINKILMIGTPYKVATLSWATTDDYAVEIKSDRILISDTEVYALTDDYYLFSDNTTLGALKTNIEGDWPITVTIETGYTTLNSKLLKTGTGKEWYGAVRDECNYRIVDDGLRTIELFGEIFSTAMFNFNYTNNLFIMWNAGYSATATSSTSVYPKGLQLTVAYILRDQLNIKKMGNKGMLKAEQIKNYSYQNWNPGEYNIKNVLDNYYGSLEPYVKKSV